MAKHKSKIEHIRDIISELKKDILFPSDKLDELEEFVEAAEDELDEAKNEINALKEKANDEDSNDDESEDEPEYENSEELGLDILHWGLENGNLVIIEHMEQFIEQLKQKFAMIPS